MAKTRFYVIWKGRKSGVYSTWAEAEAQVKGFAGAEFKSFESRAEAERAFGSHYRQFVTPHSGQAHLKPPVIPIQERRFMGVPPILESLSVDAACAGVPGPVEFRGVRTATGEQVFHFGPFPNGTNNIGEFLAIVEALRLMKEQGENTPIYSDSVNALLWIKSKQCRTHHTQNASNAALFRRIAEAETWLHENTWQNPILKWETDIWGENPADFGRK